MAITVNISVIYQVRKLPTYVFSSTDRHIAKSEGVKAFYKGLAPSLMGIMPTRAIYFYTYNKAKNGFNTIMTPNTHQVHLVSAFCGGVVGSTCMNPIFVVKTRLQLDQSKMGSNLTSLSCIRQIIQQEGMRGFYRGLTASYAGENHFRVFQSILVISTACMHVYAYS